jgi:hypothetical protein
MRKREREEIVCVFVSVCVLASCLQENVCGKSSGAISGADGLVGEIIFGLFFSGKIGSSSICAPKDIIPFPLLG